MPSSWCIPLVKEQKKGLRVRDIVLFGLLGGLMFAAKMVMAGFMNIEPVSLLVMVYASTLGRKALYPIYVYVGLEYATWGFGLWNVGYIYVWLVLALAAWLLRDMEFAFGWALLSGVFGLCFGLLFTPIYLVSTGWAYTVSWWVSGIPVDLLHCGANFVIALVLFKPMRKLLTQLMQRF